MFATTEKAKTEGRATHSTGSPLGLFLAASLIGLGLYFLFGPQAPAVPDSSAASAVLRPLSLSTEANALPTKPIEDVHVGDRVLAGNPEGSADEPDVDPATWSQVTLVLRKEGVDIDIVFLRSPQWLQKNHATPGGTVWLDLPEMDATGPARVVAIGPCPPIKPGSGRVVTGTFAHDDNGSVLDLRLEGQSEPIGVTANHRIYSEDRHAFVHAGELKVGEHLRPIEGSTQIASLTPRPGLHRVYNLEVNGEHAYRVSVDGVLVHNEYDVAPNKVTTPNAAARAKAQGEYIDPLTNKVVKTTEALAADHIFPKARIINELPGFNELTSAQQSEVLNNLENFRGLPQSLNASKGSRINWSKYRGQPLDPQYAKELAELQQVMKSELQAQIDALLGGKR